MSSAVYVPLLQGGAEQAVGAGGYGRRRRPWDRVIVDERSFIMPYCEAVAAYLRIRMRSIQPPSCVKWSYNDIKWSNNDNNITYNDLKIYHDGLEDANQNGRIDGDNGDGKWTDSEVWTELNPNDDDTDGDTFSDNNEKSWGYNPLSKDTDGDGLNDNIEDENCNGVKDSTETSAIKSDTDGDGLSDKMEIDGWTVIIIYEATLEIKEERDVYSNPLIPDYDEDGINDCGEFENGTDPNDEDTDDDGFDDKEEIDYDYGSSPTGIDGKPPTISDFDCEYALRTETSGPLWDIKISVDYVVKIRISADDIFGLEWVNVHLEGVGDKKIFTGDVTSIKNQKFEFTLSVEKAVSSLFNSFEVNITGSDQNNNIGFQTNIIPSISDLLIELFIGSLTLISNIIRSISTFLYNLIISILSYYIYDNFDIVNMDALLTNNRIFSVSSSISINEKYLNNGVTQYSKYFPQLKYNIEKITIDYAILINPDLSGLPRGDRFNEIIYSILDEANNFCAEINIFLLNLPMILSKLIVNVTDAIARNITIFINGIAQRMRNILNTVSEIIIGLPENITNAIDDLLFNIFSFISFINEWNSYLLKIASNHLYSKVNNHVFGWLQYILAYVVLIIDLLNLVGVGGFIKVIFSIIVCAIDILCIKYFYPDYIYSSSGPWFDYDPIFNSDIYIFAVWLPAVACILNIINFIGSKTPYGWFLTIISAIFDVINLIIGFYYYVIFEAATILLLISNICSFINEQSNIIAYHFNRDKKEIIYEKKNVDDEGVKQIGEIYNMIKPLLSEVK